MSLSSTPMADRVHIGLFGRRNTGKSSLINAITGQTLAVVSEIAGTTTDPVYKTMELPPLGPVVFIDTPGLDDVGSLGFLRVEKSKQVLHKAHIAVFVFDASVGILPEEEVFLAEIAEKKLPLVLVANKSDLRSETAAFPAEVFMVSCESGEGVAALKDKIASLSPEKREAPLVADLIAPGDMVVLVVPIDKAAPKGRLILPQQQTIRDILDASASAVVTKETQLAQTLANLGKKPKLVVTDSQVFALAAKETPQDVLLTSFSMLFARRKGGLLPAVRGVFAADALQDGDKVLISEGCTHHRQCEDIGTVKLPGWISRYTGKNLDFRFTSGGSFPEDLGEFALVVHCGACMLPEKEMAHRRTKADSLQTPMTNYGVLIAHMQGILPRVLRPFPEMASLLAQMKQ